MDTYEQFMEDELRVADLGEYKAISRRRKAVGSSDVMGEQATAMRFHEENLNRILDRFMNEFEQQDRQIDEQIEHNIWWLKQNEDQSWGSNYSFDGKRRDYIKQLHDLKKERRRLHITKLDKILQVSDKQLDIKKELSPFRRLLE